MLCEEREQSSGKTVAQRCLIHLYVIFLVLLIKKKRKETKKPTFIYVYSLGFAKHNTTVGKKQFFCHLEWD